MLSKPLAMAGIIAAVSCQAFAQPLSSTPQSSLRDDDKLEHLVVTSTREEKLRDQLTEAVGVLTEEDLANIAPAHPADALNRIPGVHINNLGGEGHMASIRQPITTSGVYLFLEDGLPTRPTGFFNHNGLYEINMPQGSRVEVIKGPASALYGSDAIGGVINVITRESPVGTEFEINGEVGSDGWRRALLSAGGGDEALAARLDVNLTASDGFRDEADYERQSLTGRIDAQLSERWSSKVIVAYSTIDQSGVSGLEAFDYINNTRKNRYHDDIGFRNVDALRVSADFSYEISDTQLLNITPFYRDNSMTMMPSWMVTYDPNIRDYEFYSYGALLKYRQRFFDDALEVITGIDLDQTPSNYREEKIAVTQQDDIYTDYQRLGALNYRFDADQQSVSPYLHVEYQLNSQWRMNVGLRHDRFSVDYDNKLPADPRDFSHRRPSSEKISYDHTSPKFGVVYQYLPNHNAYANYRYAFRAPTVGALFRPGASRQSTELKPVESVSAEIGFRGQWRDQLQYDIAYYDMTVENDIVSIIEGKSRYSVNAGETRHKGIELGFDWVINPQWQLGASYTRTDQTYVDFSYVFFSRACFCSQQINFAGNDVSRAPKDLANVRVVYTPERMPGLRAEVEWDSVGQYYTDQTNTQRYGGHDLWNLRVKYAINADLEVYLRGVNLADKRYSTYTSNQVNDPDISYRPGMPRSVFAGIRWML